MTSDSTSLLQLLQQYGPTAFVLVLILTGQLVTKRESEGWHSLYLQERDENQRNSETLREMNGTMSRIHEEFRHSNGRRA